jgi:hypothetical protein
MEFFLIFFLVNDIDIHQLYLEPFRILEFLVENLCFLHLFNYRGRSLWPCQAAGSSYFCEEFIVGQ